MKLALNSTRIILLELIIFLYFQLRDTDDDLGTGSHVLSLIIMKIKHSRIVMAYKYYHYDIQGHTSHHYTTLLNFHGHDR